MTSQGTLLIGKRHHGKIYGTSVKYVCRNLRHSDHYQGKKKTKLDSFLLVSFMSIFMDFLKLINLFSLC